jgi:hypothetical protein
MQARLRYVDAISLRQTARKIIVRFSRKRKRPGPSDPQNFCRTLETRRDAVPSCRIFSSSLLHQQFRVTRAIGCVKQSYCNSTAALDPNFITISCFHARTPIVAYRTWQASKRKCRLSREKLQKADTYTSQLHLLLTRARTFHPQAILPRHPHLHNLQAHPCTRAVS